MDQLDCLLQELNWDRQHLQGRNHLWRSESDNPVPGSTILEDRKRQAQSITDAKLQAAVLKEKKRRGPTAQTKIDAVVRFESLIHDHHFGGLIKQVDQVLNDRVQLKKFYDEYRKEQVEEDPTLFRFIKQGEFGRVRRLIELGTIKINSAEPVNLMTGLMKAVQSCRPKIVRLFVENHADANQENRYGQVAFHYLWDRWRCIPSDSIFKVVKLIHTIMMAEALLEYNANPNIPLPETGMTPLHVAAMYGHAQIAQLILMYKGATTIRDKQGRTALDVCREYGSKEVAGLILNWPKIGMYFGITEFRRKWESFFADDQRLQSFPQAKELLTDLAVREGAMADFKVTEVQPKDELVMAEEKVARKKRREVEEAKEAALIEDLKAKEETAGGRTLATLLANPEAIAKGVEAVSMETAMAMNVGRFVSKRKSRAPRRMAEGSSAANSALLETMAESRYKRGVQFDFNTRLAKMAGRFSDPDEMTAEQIFGRTAVNPSLKAPRGEASDAGSAKTSASSRAVQDAKDAPAEADTKEDVVGASRPGSSGGRSSTALSRPGSAASTRSGWRRRRRSTQNTIGTTYTARTGATAVSTVSSRASQALQSTRARRALAARNVAEDCYSGKLKKKYARGDTYIRKSALRSVTMRGSRLRVDDDKLALKKKLGQRAGEGMDSNNVILQMLGGADSDEEHHTEALKPRKELESRDVGSALRSYCEQKVLPPPMATVKLKPKSLVEKEREREEAKKAQINANKYNVVYHSRKKTMYRNKFGEMEDPWGHARYDVAEARGMKKTPGKLSLYHS